MKTITVSIVNVTSYTGLELLRLLSAHPSFAVTSVTARSAAGKRLCEVFPQLGYVDSMIVKSETRAGTISELVITDEPDQTDLAFVCLPHVAAAESVLSLLERGIKVVDLSADFRLHTPALYEEWYKHTHPAPALLGEAVYGLCERYRERIQGAALVANPGCYATAAILGLAPALAMGLITLDIIIDAKSCVSGAGRGLTLGTHYTEANEDVSAYSLSGHRHLPEIVQELEAAARAGGHPIEHPLRETFVHIVEQPPHTKWTYGSNQCLVYPIVDTRTRRLLVISCLDNLVKGAAGQAVQNANRLYGLAETTGLPAVALYP